MTSGYFFKKTWDYTKNKFGSGVNFVHSFGQTTLGSAIFGGIVASSATYLFGHSQLTQERNAAWNALKEHENEYNNHSANEYQMPKHQI